MKRPRYLQPGDRVAIVAPARKISHTEMDAAVNLLRSWQLEVVLPDHLFDSDHQFAGSDATRAETLQQQLDDPDIGAIFCARGGYGTVRIIDQLDFTRFCQKPKWIVGYSDITVLHSHIHSLLGLPTLHATMPVNFGAEPSPATESLRRFLFGMNRDQVDYTWEPNRLNRSGKAHAPVVGGNLSILYSMLGSRSQIDTHGKILLVEDLDEYLYHIDRMMQALRRASMLDGLAGLIVGGMTDMHDNTVPFGHTAEEIVADAVAGFDYPVAFGAPFA